MSPLIRFLSESHGYGEPAKGVVTLKGIPPSTVAGGELPTESYVLGYWQNQAGLRLSAIPSWYDYIVVDYAVPTSTVDMTMLFVPNASLYADEAAFIADITAQKAAGKKIILGLGGPAQDINLDTTARRDQFSTSVLSLITTYGFDGIDVCFRSGNVLTRITGDNDFTAPTTPAIVNAIAALTTIYDTAILTDGDFTVSFTATTFLFQKAYESFGTAVDRTTGSYLPLVQGCRNFAFWLTTECYDSANTYDRNGTLRQNTTGSTDAQRADFLCAMNDMVISGFGVEGTTGTGGNEYEGTLLFLEDCDTTGFNSRGWYDGTANTEVIDAGALKFTQNSGSTTPVGRTTFRRAFAETDSVYLRFFIRFSSNWVGTNAFNTTHMFYFLTNSHSAYAAPTPSVLTVYVDILGNIAGPKIVLKLQDISNIDQSRVGQDLTDVTEARAAIDCNGTLGDVGDGGSCYASGGGYANDKWWITDSITNKTEYHKVEIFLKMNSVVAGKGVADGIIKMWVDDVLDTNKTAVLFHTATYPNMKFNQFMIAPYISPNPATQTIWLDAVNLYSGATAPVQKFTGMSPHSTMMGLAATPPEDPLTYPTDVSSRATTTLPSIARPAYLSPITDSVFGTTVMRISDDTIMGMTNARHHYSKDQPWNCDGTLIKLNSGRLVDGVTYAYLGTYSAPTDGVWSNADPEIVYGVSGATFVKHNVLTDTRTTLHTFTGVTAVRLGPSEGNVSWDDRYVALAGQNGVDLVIFVYDILTDAIVSQKTFASGWANCDWVSISPSGEYVILELQAVGDDGIDVYDSATITFQRRLTTQSAHADMGYDVAGNEVLVKVNPVVMYRLDNGASTSLLTASGHVSCRNIERPGWAYVTATATTGHPNEVIAVKLQASPVFERFAHTHADTSTYEREPQGVPNRDGTIMMFASHWLNVSYTANSYIAFKEGGVDATTGGYIDSAVVDNAVAYLKEGTTYTGRGYTLDTTTGYPSFRGCSVWSINYDQTNTPPFDFGADLEVSLSPSDESGTEPPPPPPPPVEEEYLHTYYAATNGTSGGQGTLSSPWDILTGLSRLYPGDRLLSRGGTYSAANPGGGYTPTFRTARSGTGHQQNQRITIQNYPGETPILRSSNIIGPVFGAQDKSYIWWDGVETDTATGKGAIFDSAAYCRIRNCKIHGITLSSGDNCNGIRTDGGAHDCVIEYNTIYDVDSNASHNHCGIQVYASQGITMRYNRIYDCTVGIYIKETHTPRNEGHIMYRNYFSSCPVHSLYVQSNALTTTFYENLVEGQGTVIQLSGDDGTMNGGTFYSNTIINGSIHWHFGEAAEEVFDIQGWDNIQVGVTAQDIVCYDTSLSGHLTYWDYNRYYRVTGSFTAWIGKYTTNQYLNFTSWRSLGFDQASSTGDPGFVASGDYRLSETSPCKNAGRYGRDLGCYTTVYWLPQCGAGHAPVE